MPKHRGFNAWITCDGDKLDEYLVEVNAKDGDVVECWVPSQAGKSFSVCWQNENKKPTATSGHIFIDGVDLASAIARPGRKSHVERSGAKTTSSHLRPFQFSVLPLTDDEKVAPIIDPSVKEIGTIRVEITRVILGAEVPFKAVTVEERGPVHEKAKKAGAHVTKFGDMKRSTKGRTSAVSNAPYDPDRTTPWVTFIFRYRSREFLMAQDIIPNPSRKRRATPEMVDMTGDDDESARKKVKLEAREAFERSEEELAADEAAEMDLDPDADPDAELAPEQDQDDDIPASSPKTEDDGNGPRSSPAVEVEAPNERISPAQSPEPELEIPVATMVEPSQTQDHSQVTPDQSQTQDDSQPQGLDGETLVG
ncbi:hypothetical protein EXIGLDRAFT_750442 [Exidia glandulosa HHB12029]|uniref:DUF7918 domain-containing protein n=1 Tax=Exidia glandulosa HHB12029 TaxID=1314781 RepID=A0A165GR34_EXIGL|nr:hypothetical protein EXIGLDRAFT_750442 [Exidia glandulosa HHB12029]